MNTYLVAEGDTLDDSEWVSAVGEVEAVRAYAANDDYDLDDYFVMELYDMRIEHKGTVYLVTSDVADRWLDSDSTYFTRARSASDAAASFYIDHDGSGWDAVVSVAHVSASGHVGDFEEFEVG